MKKILLILTLFLSSCYGTYYLSDAEYDDAREEHASLTYHDSSIYWGWSNGYYYYYGTPHIYPWWYYYTLMPHYTYSVHTHVTIYCNNGYYVSKPRGPKYNNNRGGTYKPNRAVIKTHRTNINKTNIRVNTKRNNVKVNTNKTNIRNNSKSSNKNRTNVKINRTNSNKSNNKTFNNRSNNRSNKTNIRKNTRKPR